MNHEPHEPKVTLALLVVVIAAAIVIAFALVRKKPSTAESPKPYVRVESKEILAFYKPYAEFMPQTPPELLPFLARLEAGTGLKRSLREFPTDRESLQKAATVFAAAARDVFKAELSLENPQAEQLDRFINSHLIDERLRPFFKGEASCRKLSEKESEQYGTAAEAIRIPNEPLLYYAMGAFWGEWLVRYRNAVWKLYPPLNPIQSFPDMITAGATVCLHPFSQVVKKLSDPEGGQLTFKAALSTTQKRVFPPYPLIASLSDVEKSVTDDLPESARLADLAEKAGDLEHALTKYAEYMNSNPISPRLMALAIQCAQQLGRNDWVEDWSRRLLRLVPRHPMVCHNLAVVYSNTPGRMPEAISLLETALKEDPQYGMAHYTLGSCLAETGRFQEARAQLAWVIKNDDELKKHAEKILADIKDK